MIKRKCNSKLLLRIQTYLKSFWHRKKSTCHNDIYSFHCYYVLRSLHVPGVGDIKIWLFQLSATPTTTYTTGYSENKMEKYAHILTHRFIIMSMHMTTYRKRDTHIRRTEVCGLCNGYVHVKWNRLAGFRFRVSLLLSLSH